MQVLLALSAIFAIKAETKVIVFALITLIALTSEQKLGQHFMHSILLHLQDSTLTIPTS